MDYATPGDLDRSPTSADAIRPLLTGESVFRWVYEETGALAAVRRPRLRQRRWITREHASRNAGRSIS